MCVWVIKLCVVQTSPTSDRRAECDSWIMKGNVVFKKASKGLYHVLCNCRNIFSPVITVCFVLLTGGEASGVLCGEPSAPLRRCQPAIVYDNGCPGERQGNNNVSSQTPDRARCECRSRSRSVLKITRLGGVKTNSRMTQLFWAQRLAALFLQGKFIRIFILLCFTWFVCFLAFVSHTSSQTSFKTLLFSDIRLAVLHKIDQVHLLKNAYGVIGNHSWLYDWGVKRSCYKKSSKSTKYTCLWNFSVLILSLRHKTER